MCLASNVVFSALISNLSLRRPHPNPHPPNPLVSCSVSSNRRVSLLGEPAALPVFPGAVPDGPVRGGRGVPVPCGAPAEPRRPRGAGPVRAGPAA